MNSCDLVVKGRYPWNSAELTEPSLFPKGVIDNKQNISKCLSCPKAQCTNCLCTDETALALERFEELLTKKMTVKQICAMLHISQATFYRYKTACAY